MGRVACRCPGCRTQGRHRPETWTPCSVGRVRQRRDPRAARSGWIAWTSQRPTDGGGSAAGHGRVRANQSISRSLEREQFTTLRICDHRGQVSPATSTAWLSKHTSIFLRLRSSPACIMSTGLLESFPGDTRSVGPPFIARPFLRRAAALPQMPPRPGCLRRPDRLHVVNPAVSRHSGPGIGTSMEPVLPEAIVKRIEQLRALDPVADKSAGRRPRSGPARIATQGRPQWDVARPPRAPAADRRRDWRVDERGDPRLGRRRGGRAAADRLVAVGISRGRADRRYRRV